MKRIYALAIGLALLGAPMVVPTVATADPGARSMDYQQATDVVIARGLSQRGVPFSWAGAASTAPPAAPVRAPTPSVSTPRG